MHWHRRVHVSLEQSVYIHPLNCLKKPNLLTLLISESLQFTMLTFGFFLC